MFQQIQSWLQQHQAVLWWTVALSIVTAVGSIIGLPWVLIGLPADYFRTRKRTVNPFGRRHPVVRWTVRILKTAVGLVLVFFGIALLVLPGQGLLMVLAGLVLAEFPGKRWLELSIVRRPRVMRALNWVRRKAKEPPFEPPHSRGTQDR